VADGQSLAMQKIGFQRNLQKERTLLKKAENKFLYFE